VKTPPRIQFLANRLPEDKFIAE